jgi:DNA sulfur modification protein DndE
MAIEHIRLSKQARDQLIKLKRRTGIKNWNVLCRWAFAVSMAEPTTPAVTKIPADSTVEMTWKVFGGTYADVYWALLMRRCQNDGIELTEENLHQQFRIHLHRGIAYLAADRAITNVSNLVAKANRNRERELDLTLAPIGDDEEAVDDTEA